MAIQDADHETELVDAEPCPPGLLVDAGINPWMLMDDMGTTSLAGIQLVTIGRNDNWVVFQQVIVKNECAHVRQPSPRDLDVPVASCRRHVWSNQDHRMLQPVQWGSQQRAIAFQCCSDVL